MIKNQNLFIIGLALLLFSLILKNKLLGFADCEKTIWDYQLWTVLGGLSLILSFYKRKKTTSQSILKRENFKKIPIFDIQKNIVAISTVEEPDIPLIVDYIIFQAIKAGASDIHFDPGPGGMSVKYRLEGFLREVTPIEKKLTYKVINRLKILSNLIIYKDSTPQDGRFEQAAQTGKADLSLEFNRSGLSKIDFRIAFMPTLHGERVVIRILQGGSQKASLDSLGLDAYEYDLLTRLLTEPQGMIILTGPTGSGKTTTIFSSLQEIINNSGGKRSIVTLEDPIEFDYRDINQSQVEEERGFTFEKGLRALLRQDPDVIMVGEIRDKETAQIALQAGMTGHLLITTVHSASCSATFARLMEMGIPAYSLNAAVTAIIGQRLLRKICSNCSTQRPATEEEKKYFQNLNIQELKLHEGIGCNNCEDTGYSGRMAIFEILIIDEGIRKLISQTADSEVIYEHAKKNGMLTLWDSGLKAVLEGKTTILEFERTISSRRA